MSIPQSERVSAEQIENMISFLESNQDLALGLCRSKEGRQNTKRLWGELSNILNSLGHGATKDGPGWSKYWSEYKNRLKSKIRSNHTASKKTGGGPVKLSLTPLEERAQIILGENLGCPLSGVQINPLESQDSQSAPFIHNMPVASTSPSQMDYVSPNSMEVEFHLAPVNFDEPIPVVTTPVAPVTVTETTQPRVAVTQMARPSSTGRRCGVRRERTRPRLHTISELHADLRKIEESRVASEKKTAEALTLMANSMVANSESIRIIANAINLIATKYAESLSPPQEASNAAGIAATSTGSSGPTTTASCCVVPPPKNF